MRPIAGFGPTSARSPACHHGPNGHEVVSVYVRQWTVNNVAVIKTLTTMYHCHTVATGTYVIHDRCIDTVVANPRNRRPACSA